MLFSTLFSRRAEGPDPTTIEHSDLQRALGDGACVLVDVREPQEFASGRIPGAVNIPLSRFDAGQLPSGKRIVLVCRSGVRSARALRQALASGRDDACHYPGGIIAWRANGGNVVT